MNRKVYKIPYLGYFTRAYTFGDIFKKTPLIILHGGPGGAVGRYEPLEKLAEKGIPLIFYDQIGGGYSKVPKNHKITWNFKVFLDEFDNLIKFFGLKKYYLLGHSWGGMLALESICNRNHKSLKKLILFSTLPSTKRWNDEHLKMIEDFTNEEKTALLNEKDGKKYDELSYKSAIRKFYKKYVGKKSREFYKFKAKRIPKTSKEVYEYMWGKSELFGTGILANWSVENKLNKVDVPTLIMSGKFDESSPDMNEYMHKNIKNSKWILLKKSHHIGYVEETDLVIKELLNFLKNSL